MAGSLSGDQVAQFRRDGLLFPLRVFDKTEAAHWRARFESVEARAALLDLPSPFADFAASDFHLVSVAAAELARHPAIIDLVEPILGGDVLCRTAELQLREPQSDEVVPMHQNPAHLPLEPADHVVTVWVALSDVLEPSGAIRCVRASHLDGTVAHIDGRVGETYWADDEISVELAPGEATLLHGLIVHGSGRNETDARRVGVALHYASPHVRRSDGEPDFALVVRGTNQPGRFAEVSPPDADFSVASLELHHDIRQARVRAGRD